MISRKELFAEISNEAVCEGGEVVGYFVRNNRMDTLEQMLCISVPVKLPRPGFVSISGERMAVYLKADVEAVLTSAGIKWEAE
ncbi:TPA: hypothetical protein ACTW6G_002915 [Raoultella ornithinolytica]